jgi:hypothetical protein
MLALFYLEEDFLSHFYPTSKLSHLVYRPPIRQEFSQIRMKVLIGYQNGSPVDETARFY